jgi:hypothetical protein
MRLLAISIRSWHRQGPAPPRLVENLQNFTAREQVDYRTFGAGGFGDNRGGGSASFDYTATLARRGSSFAVKESRRVTQAAMEFPLENQDIGLPEMALIFHPDLRPDYDMKCEAATNWEVAPRGSSHSASEKTTQTIPRPSTRTSVPILCRCEAAPGSLKAAESSFTWKSR